MQAKPNRDERAYVLSDKLIEILDDSPAIWPSARTLRMFLQANFNGAGFRNEFLGLARKQRPVSKSFLRKIAAYLLREHRSRLSESFALNDATSVDDFLSQIIQVADVETQPAQRNQDIVSAGPAVVFEEMLKIGHDIGNAGPMQPNDVDLAATVLAASLADAYCTDLDLPHFQESAEIGYRLMRQSPAETKQLLLNWIKHCPNSIWIRKDRSPDKTLLTMAMPLLEKSYQGFLSGEMDENEVLVHSNCQRSSKILYFTASGDARNTRRNRFNLMIMSQNQLQTMMLPVTQHDTKFVTFFHEGRLGLRAANWGFRDSGNVAKRYHQRKIPGGFLPEVRTAELLLPVPRLPSKRAILWALFFLWQCFHGGSRHDAPDA